MSLETWFESNKLSASLGYTTAYFKGFGKDENEFQNCLPPTVVGTCATATPMRWSDLDRILLHVNVIFQSEEFLFPILMDKGGDSGRAMGIGVNGNEGLSPKLYPLRAG